jgi:hypothetical protein
MFGLRDKPVASRHLTRSFRQDHAPRCQAQAVRASAEEPKRGRGQLSESNADHDALRIGARKGEGGIAPRRGIAAKVFRKRCTVAEMGSHPSPAAWGAARIDKPFGERERRWYDFLPCHDAA